MPVWLPIELDKLEQNSIFLWKVIRCLAAIYYSGNDDETYGVIYEVIHEKFRASLEPLWAENFARNIE